MVQELLNRLHCFVLRPAATVNRLIDPEEDEVSDDIDTDELMRSMGPKNMIAPRYRWRRSRWLRFCPVALSEGNIVQGKAEFTVRSVSRSSCGRRHLSFCCTPFLKWHLDQCKRCHPTARAATCANLTCTCRYGCG